MTQNFDKRSDSDKGFTSGLWYAIEQLVLWQNDEDTAQFIIDESGIPEWEFRNELELTNYHVEEMSKFLDKIF